MALIGNNADTLLNGLSAFWHRFFKDLKDIQTAYEGTEILLGQLYLNLLSDVLNTSVVEAPLFRKEFYKLITVREDQLVYREHGDNVAAPAVPSFYGNPGTNRYVYTSDTFFGAIPHLQDTLYAPAASLEEGVDYRTVGAEIQFKVDPTDPVLPGYAQRRVTVGIGGKFASDTTDWVAAGVEKGDTLYYSEKVNLGTPAPVDQQSGAFAAWLALQDDARMAKVVYVTPEFLSVSTTTPLPTFPTGAVPSGFSWRVIRQRDDGIYNTSLAAAPDTEAPFTDGQLDYTSTLSVDEISFWAVDAKVDDLTLYNTYGYFFFQQPRLSTESYRALIRGLMQLYILGPAMARLESALNLTAGLPTIREEGEILHEYSSGIAASGTTGSLLADDIFHVPDPIFSNEAAGGYVKISSADNAANLGTFNILEYIDAYNVRLKPNVPFIPEAAVKWLYTPTNTQTVTTDKNTYTYPLETPIRDDVKDPANFDSLTFKAFEAVTTAIIVTDYVQDPQWWHSITIPPEILPGKSAPQRTVTPQLYPNILGEVGQATVGDPGFYIGQDEDGHVVAAPFRHNAAFILMDRFLKLHMFGVLIDPSVTITGVLINDLQKILSEVKPVHTALYFRPATAFLDTVDVTDTITVGLLRRFLDTIGTIDNALVLGSSWNIGDTWQFANPTGGALTLNTPPAGILAVIGGADPAIQPTDPGDLDAATNIIDRPLYVYMHTELA